MRHQLNARATSETTRTSKPRYTIHDPIRSNKTNVKWGLWMSNDIRGTCGPKASRHLSYRWGKTPKKTLPRKPVPTGDRTRPRCVTGAHATACSIAVDEDWYTREYSNTSFQILVLAARKLYVSGQGFLFKKLSTLSPLQAPEVLHRNFRTLCISSEFQVTDNNTFLAVSPADLIT